MIFVSVGELRADPTEAPAGQLQLDDARPPSIERGGGGTAARFATWVSRLGGSARLIVPAGSQLVGPLEAAGVEVCTPAVGEPDACLKRVVLLYVDATDLFASPLEALARQTLDAARRRGALIAVELSAIGWMGSFGAPRTAYQLATLRPDLLFASRTAADELAIPLEGVANVAVTSLGTDGCVVFGRMVPSPAPAGAAVTEPTATSALAAAFCVAYVEGASPLEAAGRAVLVASAALGEAASGVA